MKQNNPSVKRESRQFVFHSSYCTVGGAGTLLREAKPSAATLAVNVAMEIERTLPAVSAPAARGVPCMRSRVTSSVTALPFEH